MANMVALGGILMTTSIIISVNGQPFRLSAQEEENCLVPLPYYRSKLSLEGRQFYHSWQCIYDGLLRYTNIAPDCSKNVTHFSNGKSAHVCCNPDDSSPLKFVVHRDAGDSPFRRQIEQVFPISNEHFLDDPDVRTVIPIKQILPKRPTKGVCNVDITDEFATSFLKKHLLAKGIATSPRTYANMNIRPTCSVDKIYPSTAVTVINRAHNRRMVNGQALSAVLGGRYVDELRDYTLKEQFGLFSTSSVIILAHGAALSNLIAGNSWQNQDTIPTSAIVVCPPYLHCGCLLSDGEGDSAVSGGTCGKYYNPVKRQDVLMSTIVFEHSTQDCSAYCAAMQLSNMTMQQRRRKFRDIATFPVIPMKSIAAILSKRVFPRVYQHCLGKVAAHGNETRFSEQTHMVHLDEYNCRYSSLQNPQGSTTVVLELLKAHAYAHAVGVQFCGAVGDMSRQQTTTVRRLISAMGMSDKLTVITSADAAYKTILLHEVLQPGAYNRLDLFTNDWMRSLRKIADTLQSAEISTLVQPPTSAEQATPGSELPSPSAPHSIVVHIARQQPLTIGSDQPSTLTPRYIPNKYYLNMIAKYRTNTSRVWVYSDTEEFETFEEFFAVGCDVRLDYPQEALWERVMTTDVFIMANTLGSYVPALASNATVVYTPMDLPALPGWVEMKWKTGGETQPLRTRFV